MDLLDWELGHLLASSSGGLREPRGYPEPLSSGTASVTDARRWRSLLAAVLVVIVASCAAAQAKADTARHQALIDSVRATKTGEAVDLRTSLGSDWDRIAFLGPYSRNDDARKLLGFGFDYEAVSPWLNTEGGAVVVLAKGDAAAAWFPLDSGDVDTHCLYGSVLPVDGTSFVARPEENVAFYDLIVPGQGSC
jgi:hypothetical protein